MDDLLTTRQVQDRLKVDRITVYRMLQDGRLKGVKIGQQWRFATREVERLLGGAPAEETVGETAAMRAFPTHCVQTIQNLFSDISQTGALVIDPQGEPLTEPSALPVFCQLMLNNSRGREACQKTWQAMAQVGGSGGTFTCHAGLHYCAAPIQEDGEQVGWFLAGQMHLQAPDAEEQAALITHLAAAYGLDPAELAKAARQIPVAAGSDGAPCLSWTDRARQAVEAILKERAGLVERLQKIAEITQI